MKRILIADDKSSSRELIRLALETPEYVIEEAADGVDALGKARRQRPDLILLDVQMPLLDGFAVLASLQSDPSLCSIPVIAFTANAMQGDRDRALSAGFTAYLAKPVSLAQVRSEVRRLLATG